MKHLSLVLAFLVVLVCSGCVTEAEIRQAQSAVAQWQEVATSLQNQLTKAEQAGLDAELVAAIRAQLANAEAMGVQAQQTLEGLQEGDPWWMFTLKVLSGAAGAAAIYAPQLKALQRGLAGAVRFADGLKKATDAPKELVKSVAAATVNDNEQDAIKKARRAEGV